jgi:hypothetical protein
MRTHMLDLGFSRRDVEEFLVTAGYWDTASKRERHACVLTPSAYILHEEPQLTLAAKALYAGVMRLESVLAGLSQQHRLLHAESQFLRMAKSASHGLLRPGEDLGVDIPPVVKIDMVRDRTGEWYAVEVDTYNPRALGTMALVDALARLANTAPASSIASNLAMLLGREREWTFIVSEKEMYYSTAYEVLISLLWKCGVSVRLISEKEAAINMSLLKCRDGPLYLFSIPENMDRHPAVRNFLLAEYRAGSIQTIYPPKAYLGSKAFLPFIATQEGVNGTVPPTALLTGWVENCIFSRPRTNDRIILKPAHSSGSKGIVRQEERYLFYGTIKDARGSKNPLWIAQEEVQQDPISITVFDGTSRIAIPYYLRLTMYATAQGIAGLKITGRPEKIVHGAPDCIQLPVIRKSI